jgi:hypothetical protein
VTSRLETPERAAARLASAQLSERERAELWARIDASAAAASGTRGSVRRLALWLTAPVLATAAAALALLIARDGEERAAPATANVCTLDPSGARLALPAQCRPAALQVDGDEWLLRGGAELARTPAGSQVNKGKVRFRVRPRARTDAPFRVRVSHGEVRVIGTVFEVSQQDGRGWVTVSEGVIEFLWHDGARERVAAGQTLHWPRRTPAPQPAVLPAPDTAADAGTPGRGVPGAQPDLDRVLDRLLQLQSQKRLGEAVELLRGTLVARGLSHLQRERISYELGLALEADGRSSCPHWLRHVERFGSQRHGQVLSERLERCR